MDTRPRTWCGMSDHTETETEPVLDLTDTPDQPESSPDRPVLTIREAADAADVSDKTIRRRLDADELPGAYLDETGPTPIWRIPVEALLAAGFTLHSPSPPDDDPEPVQSEFEALRAELERARARITDLETRAEVAEAIANERARSLEDMRGAMRMLEAAQPAPPPPTPVQETPRRRWWNR